MSYNPYQAPSHDAAPGPSPFDAEGALPVANRAVFPDICLKCGAREPLVRRHFFLSQRPAWLYATLVLGILPYFLFSSGTVKGIFLGCMCAYCQERYGAAQWARWVIALPVVSAIVLLSVLNNLAKRGVDFIGAALVVFVLGAVVVAGLGVASYLVLTKFCAPRSIELLGYAGVGPWGPVLRVAGIHPAVVTEMARIQQAAAWYPASPPAGATGMEAARTYPAEVALSASAADAAPSPSTEPHPASFPNTASAASTASVPSTTSAADAAPSPSTEPNTASVPSTASAAAAAPLPSTEPNIASVPNTAPVTEP